MTEDNFEELAEAHYLMRTIDEIMEASIRTLALLTSSTDDVGLPIVFDDRELFATFSNLVNERISSLGLSRETFSTILTGMIIQSMGSSGLIELSPALNGIADSTLKKIETTFGTDRENN